MTSDFRPVSNLVRSMSLLALLAGAVIIQGCAHPRVVNNAAFLELREAAYTHAHDGEWAQAYAIALLLEKADTGDPKIPVLKDACLKKSPAVRDLESRDWLGGNMALRIEKFPTPVITALLMYPINLLGDLSDLVSFEVGPGIGIGAKAKISEPVSLGAQAELGEALIGWRNGRLTAHTALENSVDLLNLEFRNGLYPADRLYGGAKIPYVADGMKIPEETPYDFSTDWYGVGAHVMAGVVAVNVEFHPVQLVDLVTGLLFIDPLNDNYLVNSPIRLSDSEKDAARRLFE